MQDRLIPIKTYPINKTCYNPFISELNWLSSHKEMLWTFYWNFVRKCYLNINAIKDNLYLYKKSITFGEFRIHYNLHTIKFVYELINDFYRDILPDNYDNQVLQTFDNLEVSATNHMRIVKRISLGIDWAAELWNAMPSHDSTSPHYFYKNDIFYIDSIGLTNIFRKNLDGYVNIKEAIADLENKNILYQDQSKNRTVKRSGHSFYAIKYFVLKDYIHSTY